MRRWQDKTALLMTEMAGFLRWLDDWLAARPGTVPVPLLRDTLLIHLGLTWLGRQRNSLCYDAQCSRPLHAPVVGLAGFKEITRWVRIV